MHSDCKGSNVGDCSLYPLRFHPRVHSSLPTSLLSVLPASIPIVPSTDPQYSPMPLCLHISHNFHHQNLTMAKLRSSKVVIIPAPFDDEPSALVPNSLSEKSSFFTEFLLHSYSRIHIPETLLKVRGQAPVFLSNEKSGNLVSKPHK